MMINRIVPGIVLWSSASVLRTLGAEVYTHDNKRPTLITEHPLLVLGCFTECGRTVYSLCPTSTKAEENFMTRTKIHFSEKWGSRSWVEKPTFLVGTEIYHLFEEALSCHVAASLGKIGGCDEYLPRGSAFRPEKGIHSSIIPGFRITEDRVTPKALDRLEDSVLVPGPRIR